MSHKEEIEWFTPEERMPEFDRHGWSERLLFYNNEDMDDLCTGYAQKTKDFKGNDCVEWIVLGDISDDPAVLWAYAPKGIKQ